MTLAARPRTIPAPTARRLQHVARAALFIVAAIAAGWLGILAAPILDRIIVTAAAVVLVPLTIALVVDFFRNPD
ncbi:hypothetical protein AB0O87_14570 [Microbacterium sp. NPDC076768]|jgi:hypothetical protein|uniref:hypothetical protein n=1 Tax=Microbacterium sp. NPDC076768 TaxID=3154858 RepID=UPI0034182E48